MDKESNKPSWRDPIMIFVKVSTWIAIPVIIALFAGKALDTKFGTKPWLFLACMGIGFAISIGGIYKTSIREMKRLGREDQENKEKKDGITY
jgi:F0F1-type ATP synthase assembly protein I